jgi:hypothetical protein
VDILVELVEPLPSTPSLASFISLIFFLLTLFQLFSLISPPESWTKRLLVSQTGRDIAIFTITRLAVEGVHVENHIVDPVHRVDRGWIVPVPDALCQLLGSFYIAIASLSHEEMNEKALLEDIKRVKF